MDRQSDPVQSFFSSTYLNMDHFIQLKKNVLCAFNWSKIQRNLKKTPSNRVIFKSTLLQWFPN